MAIVSTLLGFGLEVLTTVCGIKAYLWFENRKAVKAARKRSKA